MPYWPGRRWLAVFDAVVWPTLWVAVLQNLPAQGGLFGALVSALAILAAFRRVHLAVAMNHRYRFTTWRWAKVAASVVSVGWLLGLLFHR
jgi:hypothetical protein